MAMVIVWCMNVSAYPDYENPFDERQAKPTDGAIATRNGVGQAKGQAESDPVKEEGHC